MHITYTREIPIRHNVDVLVAGGGPAGVTAAVAAARQGCTVHLVESLNCLGGLGTAGMVPAFMQFTDGEHFLADGLGREVLERLQQAGGTVPPDGMGIRVETLKRVYDDMLEEAGVGFTLYTEVIDVICQAGRIEETVCAARSGLFAIRARTVIDCTGDGAVAVCAGAPYEKGDAGGDMMPGTLCSLWAGIDWEAVRRSGLGAGDSRIEEAIADGVFTHEDRHLPGMWQVGSTVGGGNIGHTFNLDGTDEESLTRACVWGRRSLLEYEKYYKEYLRGFENMELVMTGSLLGVRETRRIQGDYVLSKDDFFNRAVFEDEIGRYCYPIDIHIARPDRESYDAFHKAFTANRLPPGESYGIPYRILTPRGMDNLWAAGRCVSTDREMQGSIRVMPGCYITGQAAGVAAAMSAQDGEPNRSIDIGELQRRLQTLGAYLPNL